MTYVNNRYYIRVKHSNILRRLSGSPLYSLTLYVLNFSEETKPYIYIYAIPPHWRDPGNWNRSTSKTRINLFYIVNIMSVDILVTPEAKAASTMIFSMLNWINSAPTSYGLTIYSCYDIIYICVYVQKSRYIQCIAKEIVMKIKTHTLTISNQGVNLK